MGKYTRGSHGTFDCENYATVKLVTDVGIPDMYPQLNVIQKSLIVDSLPKLTHNDWIKEQPEYSNISLLVQLLKSNKLKKYVAREMDSSGIRVLLKSVRTYS